MRESEREREQERVRARERVETREREREREREGVRPCSHQLGVNEVAFFTCTCNRGRNAVRVRWRDTRREIVGASPPWRQSRGELMVSLVNCRTNASIIGWHLWENDLRFDPELLPGWVPIPHRPCLAEPSEMRGVATHLECHGMGAGMHRDTGAPRSS